jgi:DNA-binding MarR family transcriptional regulator
MLMSLHRPDPVAMAGVASLLAMDRTTLTAALKPLERRGLVKIVLHKSDRRSRRMALTPEGMPLLARALPVWERTHSEVEGRLPTGVAAELRTNLAVLSAAAPPTKTKR